MRYTSEIDIDLPRERVIKLFNNSENLSKWQPGLQNFEHLSGEPGQPGAKSKMLYDEGGRKIEMIETITAQNFPETFSATYEAKGVKNRIENRFEEIGPDSTRWVMENEFQFSGFMRIMALFMRGAFPKQTLAQMGNFKQFAEGS